MPGSRLALLLVIVVFGGIVAVAGGPWRAVYAVECTADFLATVGPGDQIRLVDPYLGETIQSLSIQPPPGQAVLAGHALAPDPQTGTLYAILELIPSGFALMTVDPMSGSSEFIGIPQISGAGLEVQGLTFDDDGELFAVTDDFSAFPSSLVSLDRNTAEGTLLCSLDAGDPGEAIAFHAGDQKLYHASGTLNVIFEVIEDAGTSPCTVTPIPISGTLLDDEPVQDLARWPAESAFVWKQGGAGGLLLRVTPSGEADLLGALDHDARGLAIIEVPTPCPPTFFVRGDSNGDLILSLDDALHTLNALFIPGSEPILCGDAADSDDDGALSLADPILVLNFLFVPGSDPVPPPYPDCEQDPTPDELICDPPC